jgi:hypothetical protein
MLDRFGGHRLTHSPLATSEISSQVTPRIFSPSIDAIASVNFLDHLMLLLGIEHVLDEMNFYQWHCRSPKWRRLGDMSAACPLRSAKALREL